MYRHSAISNLNLQPNVRLLTGLVAHAPSVPNKPLELRIIWQADLTKSFLCCAFAQVKVAAYY